MRITELLDKRSISLSGTPEVRARLSTRWLN